MNIPAISQPKTTAKKAVILGATGAAIGGSVAYIAQKNAIEKAQIKAAASPIKKALDKLTSLPIYLVKKATQLYSYISKNLKEIAESGKISTKGIGKTAAITGGVIAGFYLIKNLLPSKGKSSK